MDEFRRSIELLGKTYNFRNATSKRLAMKLWDYKCEKCNADFQVYLDTVKTSGVYCPLCKNMARPSQNTVMTTTQVNQEKKELKKVNRRDQKKGKGKGKGEMSDKAQDMLEQMT